MEDPGIMLIVAAVTVLTLYAPWAALRAWRRYLSDTRTRWDPILERDVPDRSGLLLLLATLCSLVAAALPLVFFVAARRIAFPDTEFRDSGYLLGIAIILLGLVPVIIDRFVERIARAHGDGTPPPFRETD